MMVFPKVSKRIKIWLWLLFACTLLMGLHRTQTTSIEKNASYYPLSQPGLIIAKGSTGSVDEVMVHTLSIVELNKNGHRFWGYYTAQSGIKHGTDIGLAYSNDLVTWTKSGFVVAENLRWGTVVVVDGVIQMFGTRNYGGDSYIVRLSSNDGVRFTQEETVVPAVEGQCNQNPFIFFEEDQQQYRLYYFHGWGSVHSLEEKHAGDITELAGSRANLVMTDYQSVLAAPSIFYREGRYWLTAETCPVVYGIPTWQTLAFVSKDPVTGFTPVNNSPILVDDEACFFPYIFDNRLVGTYSHQYPDGTWEMYRRTYDFAGQNRIKLIPSATQLKPGQSRELDTVFYQPHLQIRNVVDHATWTTSDHEVITVNRGKITAQQPGSAVITVSYGGVSATAQVKVTN